MLCGVAPACQQRQKHTATGSTTRETARPTAPTYRIALTD